MDPCCRRIQLWGDPKSVTLMRLVSWNKRPQCAVSVVCDDWFLSLAFLIIPSEQNFQQVDWHWLESLEASGFCSSLRSTCAWCQGMWERDEKVRMLGGSAGRRSLHYSCALMYGSHITLELKGTWAFISVSALLWGVWLLVYFFYFF